MKARSTTHLVLAAGLAVAMIPWHLGKAQQAGKAPSTSRNAAQTSPKNFKNRYAIEMVYIPPGQFTVGPAETDIETAFIASRLVIAST